MKVVLYSKTFWPCVGGVGASSQLLARALRDKGHAVKIFTSTMSQESEINEGYSVCRSSSLLSFVRTAMGAEVVVMKGGVSAFAGVGALIARVPKVVIWHEMAGPLEHPGSGFLLGLTNIVRRYLARQASAHVCVSHACLKSKGLTSRSCKSLPRVIYNPVADELLESTLNAGEAEKDVDVLFVGRLIAGKGIFVLAESLRILGRTGIHLRVSIVGDGDERERLEALMRSLPGMSVQFAGPLKGNLLARSYAAAKVLVVPSSQTEGMGMVAAEGMAFGLPTIVSDQPALKEVVGGAGIVVPAGDAASLASALNQLLSDSTLRNQLSEEALKRSAAFRMGHFEEGIAKFFREIAT